MLAFIGVKLVINWAQLEVEMQHCKLPVRILIYHVAHFFCQATFQLLNKKLSENGLTSYSFSKRHSTRMVNGF